MYGALGRQQSAIASQLTYLDSMRDPSDPGRIDFEYVRASFVTLDAMVVEQISTADDALEDWRDLVPDEVADVERQAQEGDQPR